MAEDRPGGGTPTEPPSDKKLRDARRRGDVARSKELPAAAVFLAVFALGVALWPAALGALRGYLVGAWGGAGADALSASAALALGAQAFAGLSLPVAAAAFVAALTASYAQVGSVLSFEPVKPSLRKINPALNAGSVFGKRAGAELIKSVIKLGVIGAVVGWTLWQQLPQLVRLVGAPPEKTLAVVGHALLSLGLRVGGVSIVLALADLLYQRMSYLKRMRMTKQELLREQREMEGDPQHKSERQRLHRELVEHRMVQSVAEADCVVINPTQIAVALRYDAEKMEAPKVMARGRNAVAAKIKAIARRHGVPIIRDVPLARALVELELDDEVPPELYEAVAEVLRFVYHLAGDEG